MVKVELESRREMDGQQTERNDADGEDGWTGEREDE